MSSVFLALFFIFLSYYLSCYSYKYSKKYTYAYLLIFIIASFYLRITIPLSQGADFLYYVKGRTFDLDLSRPFEDFMVSVIYRGVNLFIDNKLSTIKIMYWLVYLSSLFFYVWIVFTKLNVYKKILLFSATYFLFAFTLLRNATSYQLVFLYFYFYVYYNRKRVGLLITAVTFHFSSLIILLTRIKTTFLKRKIGFSLLLALLIILSNHYQIISFDIFVHKLKSYYNMPYKFNTNHLLWLLFVISLAVISFKENPKGVLKTRLLLLLLLFISFYLINPIPAFRISIYFLIVYCVIPNVDLIIKKKLKLINKLSLVLIILFYLSYIKTLQKDFEVSMLLG